MIISNKPISWTIFLSYNSVSMENWFQCNSSAGYHITTKFCTCHDSTAVMLCAKFHIGHFITIWKISGWNFHHIWITMEKTFVKWIPELKTWHLICNSVLQQVEITDWGQVMHICIHRLCNHWFIKWFNICSAPNHYLNQCCLIVN